MDTRKKPFYRYCIVPKCKNTIRSTPNKIFFLIPSDVKTRTKWCKLMKRDEISPKSCLYCCEDHFNIDEDTVNYVQYNIMKQQGAKVMLRLKKGVVPHIFPNQERKVSPQQDSNSVIKKQRLALVNDAVCPPQTYDSDVVHSSHSDGFDDYLTSPRPILQIEQNPECSTSKLECKSAIIVHPEMANTSKSKKRKTTKRGLSDTVMKERDAKHLVGVDSGDTSSVELTAECYDHKIESSSVVQSESEKSTGTTLKNLPQRSGDLAEHFESEALIHRVYNYLQTEYELLKSLNANTDCDLSPLSNILQRTAEAIGITPQMVSDVLNKKNLTKVHCSQIIKSEHNYYIDYSIREGENREEEEEQTITAQNTEDYIPDFKRRKHNTKEIKIKQVYTEDYIPDLKLIEHNSKEFIIIGENIDDYNSDFKKEQHNTEEIRIKKENTELYSTDFNIEELDTEEFRIKEENTEDFGLRDDNIENNTEDDRRNKFTKDNCNQQINEELIMKCEVFDDPLSLSTSTGREERGQARDQPYFAKKAYVKRKRQSQLQPVPLFDSSLA